jgi:hypothetical protein
MRLVLDQERLISKPSQVCPIVAGVNVMRVTFGELNTQEKE